MTLLGQQKEDSSIKSLSGDLTIIARLPLASSGTDNQSFVKGVIERLLKLDLSEKEISDKRMKILANLTYLYFPDEISNDSESSE